MGLEFVWSVEFFGAAYMCPKGALVFLEGFMDEHVSLHFVLPVERRLTEGAFVRLFT